MATCLQEEPTEGPEVVFEAPADPMRVRAEDLRFVRQSNLLAIQKEPFDKATFQAEEEKVVDENGNVRVRLSGNTIRWRQVS